jgi:hypothetical protein
MSTLTVQLKDPFTADGDGGNRADCDGRLAGAQWFAEVYERLGITREAHQRRIHYRIVSWDPLILMLNGQPYINTEQCESVLERTSLDARFLGLVPPFVDRRNPEPIINLDDAEADDALIITGGEEYSTGIPPIERPRLRLLKPTIPQRYHVEIWCEKSTMDDVLLPLGERFGINVCRAVGEFSHSRCVQLVERARASGRPVRILYISDFDPAGQIMPVSVARKIEFMIRTEAPDLDVQVRCVALTLEQCQRYQLPRTPAKDTDRRTPGWERRYGEGITELDALEALHPGELERILLGEITRYYDNDIDDRIDEVASEVQVELDDITRKVHRKHAKELAALDAERKAHMAALDAFEKKVTKTLDKVKQDLEAAAPDPDDIEWPECAEGDEDDDPLYDSTRTYVAQIDRYKKHQGKPTEAPPRKELEIIEVLCPLGCGTLLRVAKGRKVKGCRKCRDKANREQRRAP